MLGKLSVMRLRIVRIQMSPFAAAMAIVCVLLASDAPAAVHYVDVNGAAPVPPYLSWTSAATSIQDAVDVSTNGDLVLVTNGVYAAGGRRWFDSGTNRVTITNLL